MILNSSYTYVAVPGLGGLEPAHWMLAWKKVFPSLVLLQQDDFYNPGKNKWVGRLAEVVSSQNNQVVLITHSLGCVTTFHAASEGLLTNVAGAFMVAMPTPDRHEFRDNEWEGFLPFPSQKLPFSNMLLASENDDYCPVNEAEKWADIYGAKYVNVGALGHVGPSAELGEWTQGQCLLEEFVKQL